MFFLNQRQIYPISKMRSKAFGINTQGFLTRLFIPFPFALIFSIEFGLPMIAEKQILEKNLKT